MSKKIFSCDNGNFGSICVKNLDKNIVTAYEMPINTIVINNKKRKIYDEEKINNIFLEELYNHDCEKVFIEVAQPFPQEGSVSSFKNGTNYGFMRGFCIGKGIPYELVPVKFWQKTLGISGKYGDTKVQAEEIVKNKLPYINTRTKRGKLLDGICDACCILMVGEMIL